MDVAALDPSTLERIDRLAAAGRERCLRDFAIWCVMQCRLSHGQALLLRRCILANRLEPAARKAALRAIRVDQAPRLAGAMLIGLKHNLASAVVWIAAIATTDPDAREGAVIAALHARMSARRSADGLDQGAAIRAMGSRGAARNLEAARAWAEARAMGDQCDQLDRIIGSAPSA